MDDGFSFHGNRSGPILMFIYVDRAQARRNSMPVKCISNAAYMGDIAFII